MAFVNVEGMVSRLHGSGGGFGLKESWEAQGKERHRFWAVFPADPVQVAVGDRVKVSGGLQTKVGDPKVGTDGEERRFVDHVVGRAKVEVVEAAPQAGFTAQSSPSGGGGNDFTGETPF